MKWINVIALAAVLLVNFLASYLPINGMNTGEISEMYPNLFVPAGITFAIWSVIYVLLIGFVLFPFVGGDPAKYERVASLFLLTCGLNIAWIFAWHYLLPGVSVGIMLGFLITLIVIYLRLQEMPPSNGRERWLLQIPFSVYLGWISVATIANVTAFLVDLGFNPPGQVWWTIALILVTQVLVWLILSRFRDAAFTLVIIWALVGILIKRQAADPELLPIVVAAGAGLALSLGLLIYFRFVKKEVAVG